MKKTTLLLFSLVVISTMLIVGCTTPTTTPPATTAKPTAEVTKTAASTAPNWPTSVTPVPTNPCVTCTCPYVQDDQNYTSEFVYTGERGYRYMELFLTCPGAGTGIYNTMTFNIQPGNSRDSAPDILMANYSDAQGAKDYKADNSYMSGIRYWVHDKMRLAFSNNVRNFDGLDTRWGANAAISADALSKGEQFYSITPVTCNRTWYYDAGKPVFILDAPNGMTFVMQSYSIIVDKNQTYEDLPNLGSKLNLPDGWKFRTVVLDKDLTVNGITVDGQDNQWRVTQDDLINTYSACWESGNQSSCNYRP
ncbi:MAG: hypothetical protein MUO26_10440 [Methanotrichaceae archaeon]|nr:hypothetical protein [Methanotrichaceae archaeon]